jgi:hypothetical protein
VGAIGVSSKISLIVPSNMRLRLVTLGLVLALASRPGSAGAQSSSALPPPDLAVVQVTDRGVLPQNLNILGRDGAQSAVFQGHQIWVYGDTFLVHPNAQKRSLISNSWSYTADLAAAELNWKLHERLDSAGMPSALLTETPIEQAFNQAHNGDPCAARPCGARWALWPSTILADSSAGRMLIFYMVVYAEPGEFNFRAVGNSVAIWRTFSDLPQRPTYRRPLEADHPDVMFDQSEPNFGTAAVIRQGKLYVYGCRTPTGRGDQGCRLARVNPAEVQDRSKWMFYAASGNWSARLSDAADVMPGVNIATVSWNDYLQRYICVYSAAFSQNVLARTAPQPEGPWSQEQTLFLARKPESGTIYDARLHPENDASRGQTIFVTYSRSIGPFVSEVRAVSVALARTKMSIKMKWNAG